MSALTTGNYYLEVTNLVRLCRMFVTTASQFRFSLPNAEPIKIKFDEVIVALNNKILLTCQLVIF